MSGSRSRTMEALLVIRVGAGSTLLLAPRLVARLWLGTDGTWATRFVRAVGVRDLLVCAAQLRAHGDARRRWQLLAAGSDVVDGVVSLVRAVGARRPLSAAVGATGFAAATVALRSPEGPLRGASAPPA